MTVPALVVKARFNCEEESLKAEQPPRVTLSEAKGLSRSAARSFASLRVTGLDLSVDKELSSAFEPCLKKH